MIGGHREVYVVNVAQIGCALEKIEDVRFNPHSVRHVSHHNRNTLWPLSLSSVGQVLLVDLEFDIASFRALRSFVLRCAGVVAWHVLEI